MQEQTVAAVLASDIKSNLAFLEAGAFLATMVLALIGAFLAARAYAALSEARILFWRSSEIAQALSGAQGRPPRRATPDAINAVVQRKKIPDKSREVL